MNAALHPEVIRRLDATPQADFPLETLGTLRYVWESRFGTMLLEVEDGSVKVNGKPVEPAQAEPIENKSSQASGHVPTRQTAG